MSIMSQNFRTEISLDDMTMIKNGLTILMYDAKNPRNPDFALLERLNDLSGRLDNLVGKFIEYQNEIEKMAGSPVTKTNGVDD